MRFTTPQTAARNQPACPLLKTFFRCAGQIAAPLGAPSFLIGEARRKRLQVSTKSTETRSSPRRLRNSRCRSSILNGAGAASSSALEQRLLPLLHTPSGRGLTPKRCSSGQLYSESARGTPSGTRRARDKLIPVLACNKGVFAALFPSLAPPRNAKVGRAGLMKAAKMGC